MAHLTLKSKTLIIFSTFFFFTSSVLSTDTGDEIEVDYMLKLLNALTPHPSDWSNNTNICNWTGVNCNHYGMVAGIYLSSMSLKGTIPSDLTSLFYLTSLDLHNNSLTGPLPFLPRSLQEVYLHDNRFTSIPYGCFQGLSTLQSLQLSGNTNLAPWTFPTDFDDSPLLSYLNLKNTNLTGSLPDIFHYFPRLKEVDLSNNNITGALPNSFAGSQLTFLYLNEQAGYNGLSGTIDVLSFMPRLSTVWLQGNRFEGPIPDLSNCSNLNDLRLQDNLLTGVVPPSLSSLPILATVYLDGNFLQGPVPNIGVMDVSPGVNTTNGFCLDHPGPCDQKVTILLEIAAAFGYPYLLARSWRGNNPCHDWRFIVCAEGRIRTVNLTKLNLTGTISPAFGNLTGLRNLYLGGNNLRGPLPESLATLPQLMVLDVSNNNLSGHVPRFSPKVLFNATNNFLLDLSQANRTTPSAGSSRRPSPSADSGLRPSPSASKTSLSPPWIAGQGGYGIVYQASLTDGRQVAVKVLKESKGSAEEFVNEVVTISRIGQVRLFHFWDFVMR